MRFLTLDISIEDLLYVKEMKKIKNELKFCIQCMEEHEVDIVEMAETEIFEDEEVSFDAIYQYCPIEDELIETEGMMRANNLAMKEAYRELKQKL